MDVLGQGLVQVDLFGGEYESEPVDFNERRRLERISTTRVGGKGCYEGTPLTHWGDGFKANHPFIDVQILPPHKIQDHIDRVWNQITGGEA